MSSRLARLVTAALSLTLVAPAAGAQTSLLGDKDCWSLAATCPDGSPWQTGLGGTFFTDYRTAGDPAFTDIWGAPGSVSYTHTYAPAGGATGATLELRVAGMSDGRGPWNVLFNGTSVGAIPTNNAPGAFEVVLTHVFAIPVALLTGNDLVQLELDPGSAVDGFAIDYSELVVDASAVPEPATVALLGVGLAALAGVVRRRRNG